MGLLLRNLKRNNSNSPLLLPQLMADLEVQHRQDLPRSTEMALSRPLPTLNLVNSMET